LSLIAGSLWLPVAALGQGGGAATPCGGDRCYRTRAESLGQLLASAKTWVSAGKPPRSAYAPIVEGLYEEQAKPYDEVRAHRFIDIAEGTYCQRSRLKFPGGIDRAREALKASP
jgi:hypothetical protein